jgi:hypothetical protein
MERMTLSHERAPGDIVTMTALVRDIHAAFPGKYLLSVHTPTPEIWRHNPYVVREDRENPGRWVKLDYGEGIRRAGKESIHFLTSWHANFKKQTGISVPLTLPKPDLYLSPEERDTRIIDGRYWVMLSGGKNDFTTKHWVYSRHQEVVDALRLCNIPVVQVGSVEKGHKHPILDGALDLVGKTNLREFIRLIAQSEGVICTITAAMHIAAAFDKPCVVTGGGREEWWWEGYSNVTHNFGPLASGKVQVEHQYLHTIGLLSCCKHKGCWMSKVTANEKDKNKSYCKRPVIAENGQTVPECMHMITPEHVVAAVQSYYTNGILPAIGPAPTIILPNGQKMGAPRHSLQVLQETQQEIQPAPVPTLIVPLRQDPPKAPAPAPVKVVYDNERIGGRFTICVLCYGDYYDMHKRCLSAIVNSCPADRIDLRVGSNQLGQRSMDFINGLGKEGRLHLHYCHKNNVKKYPVMREMLHDPKNPISSKWMIWFDDDSMCDKNQDWLPLLAQQIVNYPDVDMFGPARFYRLTENQPTWLRQAPWYTGKMFRDKSGKPIPNGDKVHFCVGAFWALRTEAMLKADIPCKRLGHNGGDWTIGEQLYQAGFKMKNWTGAKEIVDWSAVGRRGLSEIHPGTKNRAH